MAEYTIQQIAKMFDVRTSTLRYYEEAGILPKVERTSSGQRIFTENHVGRLNAISCFKNTGMSIAQMKQLFSYESDEAEHIEEILELLEGQKKSVAEQLVKLQNDYSHVCRKVRYYRAIKECLENKKPLPRWEEVE